MVIYDIVVYIVRENAAALIKNRSNSSSMFANSKPASVMQSLSV